VRRLSLGYTQKIKRNWPRQNRRAVAKFPALYGGAAGGVVLRVEVDNQLRALQGLQKFAHFWTAGSLGGEVRYGLLNIDCSMMFPLGRQKLVDGAPRLYNRNPGFNSSQKTRKLVFRAQPTEVASWRGMAMVQGHVQAWRCRWCLGI